MTAKNTKGNRARRARGSLSPEEILEAAYRLVEHDGLRALSMPVLVPQLHAGVTSIYWYFRNKDELLVALAERAARELYSRLPAVNDGAPWDQELERVFVAWRVELRRSPVFLELFTVRPFFLFSRPAVSHMATVRLEEQVSILARAGFSSEQAMRLNMACSTFTGASWSSSKG